MDQAGNERRGRSRREPAGRHARQGLATFPPLRSLSHLTKCPISNSRGEFGAQAFLHFIHG